MNTAWTLQTAPTIEPVSLDEARQQLRETGESEDQLITQKVKSARARLEQYLGRAFLTQTWKYTQDEWADVIWLPMAAPLQSVTSIKYYDGAGAQQTLATSVYLVDTQSEPGRILLAPDQVWPTLQAGRPMAVEVVYVAGWTAAELIPAEIIEALQTLQAGLFQFRGDSEGWREAWDAATNWCASQIVKWREPRKEAAA